VWRIWATTDGSVYVGDRRVAGRVKTSLHATGDWHFRVFGLEGSVFREFAWKRPPPIKARITKAFAVIVPWTKVATRVIQVPKPELVLWWPPPALGNYRSFTVLFGPHGTKPINAVNHPRGPQIALMVNLPNEAMFVVTRELRATEEMKRLPDYERAMRAVHDAVRLHAKWTREPGDTHGHFFGHDADGLRWFIDVTPKDSEADPV
jgi:hypothetical protein